MRSGLLCNTFQSTIQASQTQSIQCTAYITITQCFSFINVICIRQLWSWYNGSPDGPTEILRPTQTQYYATHCSSNQQEQTPMVWPCHEERRRVNSEGCNEVKDEGKETKRKNKNKTAIDNIDSHLNGKDTSPNDVLETKCFQNVQYLEDIDFTTNWQEFWGRSLSFYPEYGEQMSRPCLFSAM